VGFGFGHWRAFTINPTIATSTTISTIAQTSTVVTDRATGHCDTGAGPPVQTIVIGGVVVHTQ
jgi:hypothetical protein